MFSTTASEVDDHRRLAGVIQDDFPARRQRTLDAALGKSQALLLLCSEAMRTVLIDRHRAHNVGKRPPQLRAVLLTDYRLQRSRQSPVHPSTCALN
jgi:hypothetical protein